MSAPPAQTGEVTGLARRRTFGVFYGWAIVAAGMLFQGMNNALLGASYGAYVVLLKEQFGWSKTVFSAAYSIQQIESGIFGPLQGWMIERFGPRAVMRVGVVIFAAAFMLFSQVNSIPAFYATFLLLAIGGSLCGFFPVTVTVVNWFIRRRSTALGLVSAGSAIGGLCAPLVASVLEAWGWRTTAFVSGVLVLVVLLPATQFMRQRPEQYGQWPDGRPPEAGEAESRARALPSAASVGFTAMQALRTSAFWCVSLGHAAALLVVTAVNVHLQLYLRESLGFSLKEGASVSAMLLFASLVGQVGGGFLGDRLSKRLIVIGCMVGHMTALLLLAYATHTWMVVTFAILHGLSWGTRGPLMAAIRADYFGRASYASISGYNSIVLMAGTVSGPLVAGIMADQLGTYRAGFTVLAVLAGLGSAFWIAARPPRLPVAAA